jgi:uncharacterized membrane protein YeiH
MEALAIFAYAISGFIEARKRRLDAVGTLLVALATAFGGGTVTSYSSAGRSTGSSTRITSS